MSKSQVAGRAAEVTDVLSGYTDEQLVFLEKKSEKKVCELGDAILTLFREALQYRDVQSIAKQEILRRAEISMPSSPKEGDASVTHALDVAQRIRGEGS